MSSAPTGAAQPGGPSDPSLGRALAPAESPVSLSEPSQGFVPAASPQQDFAAPEPGAPSVQSSTSPVVSPGQAGAGPPAAPASPTTPSPEDTGGGIPLAPNGAPVPLPFRASGNVSAVADDPGLDRRAFPGFESGPVTEDPEAANSTGGDNAAVAIATAAIIAAVVLVFIISAYVLSRRRAARKRMKQQRARDVAMATQLSDAASLPDPYEAQTQFKSSHGFVAYENQTALDPPSNGPLPPPSAYTPALDVELATNGALGSRQPSLALSQRSGKPRGHRRSTHSQESGVAGADLSSPVALLNAQLDYIFKQRGGALLHKYKMASAARFQDSLTVMVAVAETSSGEAFALRFYHNVEAYHAEKRAYGNNMIRASMPAVSAVIEDEMLLATDRLPNPLNTRRLPPVVVLEKGQALESIMQTRPPAFVQAVQVMVAIAQRIQVLHAAGFAHLTLNPEAVLWLPKQRVWSLSSFRYLAKYDEHVDIQICLPYAAPEVVEIWHRGNTTITADPAIDVWSLGVMCYELLTQQRYFMDVPSAEAVRSILLGEVPLPHELGSAEPRNASLGLLRESVLSMLLREPRRRPTIQSLLHTWQPIAMSITDSA